MKVKFNSQLAPGMVALATLVFIPAASSAQLVPIDVESPLRNDASYRDGPVWVSVQREAAAPTANTRVTLRAAERVFHAEIDRRAILQLAPGTSAERLFARSNLQLIQRLSRSLELYLVEGKHGEDGVDVAARLSYEAQVIAAIPDLYIPRRKSAIAIPPNDPRYGGQWYLKKLDIERAWRLSTGDPDTIVVVIDDGCDLHHPDLEANILGGIDLVDKDNDPSFAPGSKSNAHGTQCSGLIAAEADNGIGIAGVCPQCSLRCVRLLREDDKPIAISADIQAFDYAFQVGASVVSNSWGFAEATPVPYSLRMQLERLFEQGRGGKGTLVVFSAGNENRELGSDEIDAVNGVISVGALNNFDEASPFSNYGAPLDLAAPTGTLTTDISGADGDNSGDYTDLFGGTSSACPVVAGVAGLIMSARPDMTASEVSDLLLATARHAPYASPDADGHDATYGFGVVSPAAALRSALGVTDPEPVDAGRDAAVSGDAGSRHDASIAKQASGGGCSVSASAHSRFGFWLGASVVAWLAWRRRFQH